MWDEPCGPRSKHKNMQALNPDTIRRLPAMKRWLWTELLAFDSSAPGYGVENYLSTLGFQPAGISLLMGNADFVHLHHRWKQGEPFPPDVGYYLNLNQKTPKHGKGTWSCEKLCGLVRELRSRHVKVFFSVFPTYLMNRFHQEWLSDHQELFAEEASPEGFDGMHPESLLPIKRFAGGASYASYFSSLVAEMCEDYGFDGFHLADGYNHPFKTIASGDLSDDLCGRFFSSRGMACHEDAVGSRSSLLVERSLGIQDGHLAEFMDFQRECWREFFQELAGALKMKGRALISNTSWTRDPAESLFRYGVDYADMAAAGISQLHVEAVAGSLRLFPRADESYTEDFFYVIQATLLLTAGSLPETDLVVMNSVHDETEGWSVMRDVPQMLERDISVYSNILKMSPDGWRRAASGTLSCLANGIPPEGWKKMRAWWDTALCIEPAAAHGPVLVVSEDLLRKEAGQLAKETTLITHKVVKELIQAGLGILSATTPRMARHCNGPLLIINSQWLHPDEKALIEAAPGVKYEIVQTEDSLCLKKENSVLVSTAIMRSEAPRNIPKWFYEELEFPEIPANFYRDCAAMLRDLTGLVRIFGKGNERVTPFSFDGPDGTMLLILPNDKCRYASLKVDTGRRIQSVHWLNPIGVNLPQPEGAGFEAKIPPLGVSLYRLEFGKSA